MLERAIWKESDLNTGIYRLTEAIGSTPAEPPLNQNISQLSAAYGVEAVHTQSTYGELGRTLARLSPGVLRLKSQPGFLLIISSKRKFLKFISPDGRQEYVSIEAVVDFLSNDRGLAPAQDTEPLLNQLGLHGKRLQHAHRQITLQQLDAIHIDDMWFMRPHPSRGLKVAIAHAKIAQYVLGFVLSHISERLMLIAGISLLIYSATQALWSPSVLVTWLLITITQLMFSHMGRYCQLQVNIRSGIIIKRQLQFNALHLPPGSLSEKGPAELLGQTLEAEGLHSNALSGIFVAANAFLDVLIALVMAVFLGHWIAFSLLFTLTAFTAYLSIVFIRCYTRWANQRVRLNHITIEHMQGNRTRLIQSNPAYLHQKEEIRLHKYWMASADMDRIALWLQTFVPGLWLASGLILICAHLTFSSLSVITIIGLFGIVLLAWNALQAFADTAHHFARTWYSWQQVMELLSIRKREHLSVPQQITSQTSASHSTLEACQIHYHYQSNTSILSNLNIRLDKGAKYLLQGESGSGKSTLLSLLTGQIQKQRGLLLLGDRDIETLGDIPWRRDVCWVPQFNDNYIFSGTLLYNLMLGRAWPPSQDDVEEVLDVCEMLELFPLIRKMPARLLQPIGEMGWQLSQGEASRVCLARALIQKANFILLDESLDALDTITSLRILKQLEEHESSIVLCMHP